MSEQSKKQLNHLLALWNQEHKTVHARFVEERQQLSLAERMKRGFALRDLDIIDTDAALGGRIFLWIAPRNENLLDDFRIGPGTPVRLWKESPDGPEAVMGTVSKRRRDRLGIVVDDFPDELEEGGFHLDRDEPQATFARGKRAIERFLSAKPDSNLSNIREILFADGSPLFRKSFKLLPHDPELNAAQLDAIRHAMSAFDVALIHGPPGTGKTHTLVEVIRQSIRSDETVLATAASNAAVDNLAERLADADVRVVRVGHPARVSAKMEAHTLDSLLEKTEEFQLSRKWIIEANAIRRKIKNARERGHLRRDERREMTREMRNLFRDARKQLQGAQERILSRAEVICATAAGADVVALGNMTFDLVVLDEATQATDPIAMVAFSRGNRIVMAGDPCQLPPTVIDMEVERNGLGETLFERLARRSEADFVRMLTVQYRMHETIMAFPSESMYDDHLRAAPEVAQHKLEELPGVSPDPLRPGPFWFIDSAGKGWEEERTEEDPSTSNPAQAERTVEEVRRLLERGLPCQDLAVITPYYAQVQLLRNLLQDEYQEGLEIGSIDGFQGREKEAIVLDLVRSNDRGDLGFLNDTRRMNVALTRARRFLLVVGDSATLSYSKYYKNFIEHTERYETYKSAWDDGV